MGTGNEVNANLPHCPSAQSLFAIITCSQSMQGFCYSSWVVVDQEIDQFGECLPTFGYDSGIVQRDCPVVLCSAAG